MLLTDLYARAILILRAFSAQLARLTPLWALGVCLGASLAWVLTPASRRQLAPHSAGALARLSDPLGLLTGALLGVFSPFSVLSIVGLVHELSRRRRTLALALGLCLGSVLLDPAMFTFTALALGLGLAWGRVAAALAAATLGGSLLLLGRRWLLAEPAAVGPSLGPPAAEGRSLRGYVANLATHVGLCAPHFLLALLLNAWLGVVFPRGMLFPWLGRAGGEQVLAAAALGGPLYLCGGGAIAVADGLLAQGLSPGAALAFLAFGPIATVRALAGLSAVLSRRATAVCVVAALAVALAAGYLANLAA